MTITRFSVLGFIAVCLLLGAATAPFAAVPVNLSKASTCAKGQEPTLLKPCRPGADTVIDLTEFPPCAAAANPTPLVPCWPTGVTGQIDIARFHPCATAERPTWYAPCAPGKTTVIDLSNFVRCQKGEDPTAAKPCRPTQANGQISLTSFARCSAGQQPTPDKPCAPTAATKVDFGKFPACVRAEKPTASKPCRPAGTPSTNRNLPAAPFDVKASSSSTTKSTPIPVCAPGQKSTTAKPCIKLSDNGPGTSATPSATKKPVVVATGDDPDANPPPRIAGRINDELCERAGDGAIIPCAGAVSGG